MDENSCLKKLITSYVDYDTDYEAIEAGFITKEMIIVPPDALDFVGDHKDIARYLWTLCV